MNLLTFVVTRSCPLINPRPRQITRIIYLSAYTLQYVNLSASYRRDASFERGEEGRAKSEPKRRRTSGRNREEFNSPSSDVCHPISRADTGHGENEVRDENERAKTATAACMHARTHARTRRATYSNVRGNAVQPACRLSARRSLVFSMLATR